MTQDIKFNFRYLLGIIIYIIIGTPNTDWSQTIGYSSLKLSTESTSFHVKGIYWELPLEGVIKLSLKSNKLTVSGYCDSIHVCNIVRTIPPELEVKKLFLDNHPGWFESDVIVYESNLYKRTYINSHTNDRFSYKIPFKSYYQIQHFYRARGDTSVIVVAFGKMNQDLHKWMGYILITK
jgi:hypothetical protein